MASSCKNSFNTRIAVMYDPSNRNLPHANCLELVFMALNGTSKAHCPDTSVGSPVHACMSGGGDEVGGGNEAVSR